MDATGKILLAILTSIAMICCTVLVALHWGDPVTLGIIASLVLQAANFMSTSTVATRVNGHMTTLIAAKTIPDNAPEATR